MTTRARSLERDVGCAQAAVDLAAPVALGDAHVCSTRLTHFQVGERLIATPCTDVRVACMRVFTPMGREGVRWISIFWRRILGAARPVVRVGVCEMLHE